MAVVILSPLLVVVMVWLHFANKNENDNENENSKLNWVQRWLQPVIFTQTRIGRGNRAFRVMKFKSMTDERDAEGRLLPDKERLTKVGRFIRKTSIDELPQLFNILKGDMAFIGPRPLPPVYMPYYNEEELHRHDVRPGISGWAQVNGRMDITWEHKMECDLYYVKHLTLWLDIKIFFLTVYKVFKRESVGEGAREHNSFYDYRDEQWAAEGRYDLIEKAYKESGRTGHCEYLEK